MWRSINCLAVVLLIALSSCRNKDKTGTYSAHPLGYYYRLISFHNEEAAASRGKIALVDATFSTQADSIFWDSHNNLNDNFFIRTDSNYSGNFFKYHVSRAATGDSVCLLIDKKKFYSQQFQLHNLPFFSDKDSVVKINFKLRALLSEQEFDTVRVNLQKKELLAMEAYFGSPGNFEAARDALGFYWITRPEAGQALQVEQGDHLTLSYQGQFINGRFFEKSRGNFELIYGTPDQLLKGLNYVIGKLKLGQNAKILLPSRLAFGESGSSNGIVPPYTPLIYEVKIIDVKKIK